MSATTYFPEAKRRASPVHRRAAELSVKGGMTLAIWRSHEHA